MPKKATKQTLSPAQEYQLAFGFAVERQQEFLKTPEGSEWLRGFNASNEPRHHREEIHRSPRTYEEPYYGN